MIKSAWTIKDFSPVFSTEKKEIPRSTGWYLLSKDRVVLEIIQDMPWSAIDIDFWWWNGKEWISRDGEQVDAKHVFWFGLAHKP